MIHVHVTRGSQPGRSGEFEGTEVTFGRGSAADFRFPPEDRTVGREIHFRIVCDTTGDAAACRVRNEHRNPLLVDGPDGPRTVAEGEETVLEPGASIQVGRGGPVLAVAHGDLAPETVSRLASGDPVARVAAVEELWMDRVGEEEPRRSRRVAIGVLVVALLAVAGVWRQTVRQDDLTARLERNGVSLEAYRGALAAIQSDLGVQETRTSFAAAVAGATAARLGALEATVVESSAAHPEDLLERLAESVYVVGLEKEDGSFIGIGTGWKLGPRRFATNAHVADALWLVHSGHPAVDEPSRSLVTPAPGGEGRLLAIRPADTLEGRTVVELSALELHPGYDRYGSRFPSLGFRSGIRGPEPLVWFPVCDVAILRTEDEIPGPALPIADADRLAELSSGSALGMVGFPGDARGSGDANPEPIFSWGRLQGSMDPLGESSTADESVILAVDLRAGPGSSGSPIVDESGTVVGLLTFTRGDPLHSFHFGQRVDLLSDLDSGEVDERLDERAQYWWTHRAERAQPDATADWLIERAHEHVAKQLRPHLPDTIPDAAIRELCRPVLLHEASASVSPQTEWELGEIAELVGPGVFGVVLVGTSRGDLDVEVTMSRVVVRDDAPDCAPCAIFMLAPGERPKVIVRAKHPPPNEVTGICRVVRYLESLP